MLCDIRCSFLPGWSFCGAGRGPAVPSHPTLDVDAASTATPASAALLCRKCRRLGGRMLKTEGSDGRHARVLLHFRHWSTWAARAGAGLRGCETRYIVSFDRRDISREGARMRAHDTEGSREMAQEKWLLDGPKTIDLENIRRLKVSLVGGHVDIVGHDEPGVRVEVHSVAGRELLVQIDGDRLEIDHPQLRWDNWIDVFKNFGSTTKAEVSVLVPRNVAVTLGVVSAEALVAGLEADVQLNTEIGRA